MCVHTAYLLLGHLVYHLRVGTHGTNVLSTTTNTD